MLDFEQFKDYVVDHIKDYLPDSLIDSEVRLNSVLKNNGLELTGIIVMNPEDRIAPTVYLEPFFENYRNGENLSSVMQSIANVSAENQVKGTPDMEIINNILNFESIKNHLTVCLVNAQRNEEMLAGIPYTMHEDLAAIYKIVLNVPGDQGQGTITVNNQMMEEWQISIQELDAAAKENAGKILPGVCKTMTEVMGEIMRSEGMPQEMIDAMLPDMEGNEMWVITNPQKMNGASVIVYSDVLKQLSEQLQQNLFILPSSTHEVLAVPETMGDPETLAEMVCSVNETEVSPDEQLSDHVYYYDAKSESLTLADTSVEELGLVSEPEVPYQSAQSEAESAGGRRGGHR